MEADLAFEGIDLRDLYRPGSGMTLRRLNVLVDWLPPEARVWQAQRAAQEKSQSTSKISKLRERQAFYDKQKEARGG